MQRLLSDLSSAVRTLLKEPRFTIVAALTLAIGVGSVTAIFSVVHGVLLSPLPYAHADRLVNVWSHAPKLGYDQFPLSPDLYFAYERDQQAFESMALFQRRRANLTGDGPPDVVETLLATHTWFPTLQAAPVRGRAFGRDEDAPGAPRVVVISHRAWRDRYGADEAIVGRVIRLDGEPAEIVGVAPAEIDVARSPDFFLPGRLDRANPIQGNFGWNAIARLKPGVAPDEAATHLAPLVTRFAESLTSQNYRAFIHDGGYRPLVRLMKEDLVGDLERPLWILLGTVGMLLLIACANVANLFLVRAEGRQREIAVRVALGAGRLALVGRLLVEAILLAGLGAAIGVAAAAAGLPALLQLAPPSLPRLDQVSIDLTVLAFAAGVAALSSLAFGLVPALRYTRQRALASLRHGVRGGTDDPGRRRVRQTLVVAQTAMALVLLVGSGLLARSFTRLAATDLGFDPRHVMTFRLALPASEYADAQAIHGFVDRVVERLREAPGAASAGAASMLPMVTSTPGTAHEFESRPLATGQLPPIVHYKVVAAGYFETMRIPVVAGRNFHSGDYSPEARGLIVNSALAEQYWPGENALGKRVRLAGSGGTAERPWYTVVGVVGTERQHGLRQPPRPLFYYTRVDGLADSAPRAFDFAVRGASGLPRADALREAVWSLNGDLPVASMRSLDEIVSGSIVEFTFTLLTLAIAAGIALVLGAVGLYGVLSYAVTLRTREIGVRLALGAPPSRVMRSVVVSGGAIAGIGLAIGLVAAAALTRLLGGLLFEVQPLDVPTFAAMSAALVIVALAASYLPARRAASVSPLESMRTE